MIRLPPESEFLRDTIFYSIFQKTLVMDTQRDAIQYYQRLHKEKNYSIPFIYTLDGFRVRGDGIVHPAGDVLPPLEYVFGEMSPMNLAEFKNILKGSISFFFS